MADTTFSSGTVITSDWLNDVNDHVYDTEFETVASLRASTSPGERVTTRGYYTAGDGGGGTYWRDDSDTVTVDNNGTVLVTANGSRMKLMVTGGHLSTKQCGVRGDGTTGETEELLAADGMARAIKKALFIEGIVLLDEQVWLENPTHWIFSGWPNNGNTNDGPTASTVSGSWLKVPASMPSGSSAVVVAHPGIIFTHGAIGCDPSFTWPYDGLTILANGFRWDKGLVFGMGRDGIFLGTPSGTTGGYNSNSVVLDQVDSVWNGRHGINISDDDGALDANTFLLLSPRCFNNAGHGIRFGKTYLGGTVITPTIEFNAVGLYFEADASQILILGGDIEANVGPHTSGGVEGTGPLQNVIEVTPGANNFSYVTIQGVLRNDVGTPLTTKGDVYTYSTTNARLPVGTDGQVLVADSAEATGLRWGDPGTPTIVNPLLVKEDYAGITKMTAENLSTSSGATAQVHLKTDKGTAGLWQRANVDGGEFIFGTVDHTGNIGLMSNGVIRFGFPSDGSLAIGGYSAVGTAGQVLTSGGPGAAVSWTSAGSGTVSSVAMTVPTGMTVSGSPITTSGTLGLGYATGYRAYTDAENTKLAGLPTTAVNKTGDTMSGDLTVSKADAAVTASATSGNGNLVAQSGSIIGGMRAGGGAVELGGLSANEVRLLGASGAQRIIFTTGGLIRLLGLPTTDPGVSGAVWNSSGTLRISP